MIQSFNDIAGYCGVGTHMPTSDSSTTLSVGGYTSFRLDGSFGTYVADSTTGNAADAATLYAAALKVDTQDFRTMTLAPGYVRVSRGVVTSTAVGKGAQLVLDLPAGGIACVSPAAWWKANPPRLDPTTHAVVYDTGSTAQWASRDGTPLPLAGMPWHAVDAFELVANFAPRQGQVFFNEYKTDVADQVNVQICRLSAPSTTWDCQKPTVSDQGQSWQFALQLATPGTYVLVSTHQEAGQ